MREIQIRRFGIDDAAQLADIVQRCLREVNSRDYPQQIIAKMCAHFSAERFSKLSTDRLIYVAEADKIVGTVSRDGNKVYTMFVDPDWAGRGVGRQLMRHVEQQAAEDGHDHMETGASITAHHFYLSLGYLDVRESETAFGLNYILRKRLSPPSAAS